MRALVIVGAGTAGLAAAATAAEAGLPAVVVEKTDRVGGMLHWSSGHFSGAGTSRQRMRGIDDHPDRHYRDVLALAHGLADEKLLRLAVDAAPAAVDWLERLGFDFAEESPALVTGHELYSRPRTYWGGANPRDGGRALLETLVPAATGPGIEYRLNTRVTELVLTADGAAIAGLRLDGASGPEFLEAKDVILATGGYAANRELLSRLQPRHGNALIGCLDHATGDGHEMLEAMGVALTHGDTYAPTMGMVEDPRRPGHGFRVSELRLIVNAVDRPPWEIWVNARGERFVAEDTTSPFVREEALRDQPGMEMWAVWDQAIFDAAPPAIGPDWSRGEILDRGSAERWLLRADSLAELAAAMGVDPDALARTVTAYNASGVDPWGRTHRPLPVERAPFFALRSVGGMLLSRGGPRVDERLHPLLPSGAPVCGLYAVGELLGMGRFSGDSFAGGMSVGPALALARSTVLEIAAASEGAAR